MWGESGEGVTGRGGGDPSTGAEAVLGPHMALCSMSSSFASSAALISIGVLISLISDTCLIEVLRY